MAGIAFLRRLLMKQAMKKSEDASGILSLNKNLVNDVDNTVKKWIESAKKQGQDIDKMGEQEIKYIVELNKPKGPTILGHPVIDATSPEGKGITQDLFNMLDRQSGKNVIKTDFGGGVTDIVTETIAVIKSKKPIEAMAEANSVIGRKGKYKNLTKEQSQKIIKDTEDHIFERNVDVDPEDFAHGGRTGSGLNYLLGEDDQNSRVPYAGGGASFAEYLPQLPANGYLGGSGQPNPQGGGGGEQQTLQGLQGLMSDDGSIGMPTSPQVNFSYFNPANPYARGGADNQLNVTPPKTPVAMQQPMSGQPGEGMTVPEVPGAIQQPMPGDTSSGVMTALPNLNNVYPPPTPSYDPPEVSEEQKITDPYQRAGGYKKQPATTPEEEVRNRENSVAQAVGAKPGALSQALGLAEGGRIGLKKGSKSWTDRIAGWTGGKNIMAGEIGLETWDLLNNLLQSGGLYAEGGRTGFGLGGMSKRLFLKLMGGAAAGTVAAKTGLFSLLKGGATKSVIKDLASVPIKAGADGMPLWFKPLVNKVIKEGDDVTKKFATADREIVHATKLPESQTDVIVTQDLNTGNVSVDIGMGKHGFSEGHLGQPVRLEYRASEVIEPTFTKNKETIGKAGKTKEEFWVDEAEFTGGHPENIKFEETISEKFGKHGSDFSEVEKFATGKVTKSSKIGDVGKATPDSSWTPDDYASGGRVPLAEGNTPSAEQLQQYYRNLEEEKKRRKLQEQFYDQRFGIGSGPVLEAASGGLAGLLGE